MILYLVTSTVPANLKDEWKEWMRTSHIPKVMATGCFLDYHIYKPKEGESDKFFVHYICRDIADYQLYQEKYSQDLQNETKEKFNDQIKSERAVLERLTFSANN
jgi:hypothetical protein